MIRSCEVAWKHRSAALAALIVIAFAFAFAGTQAQAGSISGTISGGKIKFAPYMCWHYVTALDDRRQTVDEEEFESSSGISWGDDYYAFELKGLVPGSTYRLVGRMDCGWYPNDSSSYVEYYRDQTSLSKAAPITMGSGPVTGIDIVLEEPDPELTPPDTVIDAGPSGTVTSGEATFEFHSTDPGNTAGFECRLDGGAFAACASPATFSSLDDGAHDFSVRAEHVVAGHPDGTPATQSFTVESPGPVVSRARLGKAVARGPARVKSGRKVTYRVTLTNSGARRATGVELKVRGMGADLVRRVGSVPAGSRKTVKVRVKPRRPGRGKLSFKATSSNAGTRKATRRIVVR